MEHGSTSACHKAQWRNLIGAAGRERRGDREECLFVERYFRSGITVHHYWWISSTRASTSPGIQETAPLFIKATSCTEV